MTDPELLRAAIAASGLSARKFAVVVLLRDERTVRRWLHGPTEGSTNELPHIVREKCKALVKEAGG